MESRFEAPGSGEYRAFIEQNLLKERTILLFGGINQEIAQTVTEKLMYLSSVSDDDIKIFINSQGGHVESGDTIFDMIRYVKPKVNVVGTGWVASAGALIFCAPPVAQRFSLPNTRFMIHQPAGGASGSASDIAIEAGEIIKMRRRLNETIAKQCGKPVEIVEKDSERNHWMSAVEGINYGLVGKIIESE